MTKLIQKRHFKCLFFKILIVFFVTFLSVAIMLPLVKLAALLGINIKENTGLNFKPSLGVVFFFFLFGFCSIAIVWLAQKYIHKKPLRQLGFSAKVRRDLFFGFLLGIFIIGIKNIIYGLNAETIEITRIAIPNNISPLTYIGYYAYFILGFILWNSFIEELSTRVYPIEKLKNYINPHIIFIIMGLIFTLGHFITREFNTHYFISLFGFSYVFSLLYFYSRSIWLVVGVHSGVNWVNFTFFGTNWKVGGVYNIKISNFPSWIYDYTGIFIYILILILLMFLNKKGFFKKYFTETIKIRE